MKTVISVPIWSTIFVDKFILVTVGIIFPYITFTAFDDMYYLCVSCSELFSHVTHVCVLHECSYWYWILHNFRTPDTGVMLMASSSYSRTVYSLDWRTFWWVQVLDFFFLGYPEQELSFCSFSWSIILTVCTCIRGLRGDRIYLKWNMTSFVLG